MYILIIKQTSLQIPAPWYNTVNRKVIQTVLNVSELPTIKTYQKRTFRTAAPRHSLLRSSRGGCVQFNSLIISWPNRPRARRTRIVVVVLCCGNERRTLWRNDWYIILYLYYSSVRAVCSVFTTYRYMPWMIISCGTCMVDIASRNSWTRSSHRHTFVQSMPTYGPTVSDAIQTFVFAFSSARTRTDSRTQTLSFTRTVERTHTHTRTRTHAHTQHTHTQHAHTRCRLRTCVKFKISGNAHLSPPRALSPSWCLDLP